MRSANVSIVRISCAFGAALSFAQAQNPNGIFLNVPMPSDLAVAQTGNAAANIRLGYRYLSGTAGVIDPVKASQYFSKAAASSPAASAWLGYVVVIAPELANRGVDGVKLVRQASDANDVVGMTLLGRLLHHGKGLSQDKNAARQLYGKAAASF